ncbi:hypothetical protein Bca52824_089236 [Brassica carinata]|uniref:Cation-transporting P-type ATPase N-terminal domain-containing protein n=1 Tax=Brassica carinata TaxID=52824 RepID=A0A8X7PFF2_BRACI|nr:hypothetical protein Bca52824_089236 [Brassica carinata]
MSLSGCCSGTVKKRELFRKIFVNLLRKAYWLINSVSECGAISLATAMSGPFKNSPGGEDKDVEAGTSSFTDNEYEDSPFDITTTKNAPVERLRRWRQAALVLNASRRFRYTLDLKREEDKKQMLRKMRAHAQAIRAAHLFKAAASRVNGMTSSPPIPGGGDFGIGQEQIVSISRDHNIESLQEFGGVKGLSGLLKTNLEKGIHGDDDDISKRKSVFGSNTYPQKKGRSFWRFVWEASQDLTLIILIVAAAASLVLGIKTEVFRYRKGWYDGISIAFAVLLVIVVTATSDYRQSLQFQNLNEEKRNIHLEVTRGGRRVEISIYDILVGDIIPLNIGDQVPADGVLVAGHSLAVDESSMTGESKIVHKNSAKNPFLMSGCKVADGHGTMLLLYWSHEGCKWSPTVTIVVVAVPEGLPLAVTLTLVYYLLSKHFNDSSCVDLLSWKGCS